jgi:HAD superfamily hydrolase (TIGR01509 family)
MATQGNATVRPPHGIVCDVDGTLVDSVYHHAMAWHRALEEAGFSVPVWRLHRQIGMGGDRYVAAALGDDVERTHGDALREAHSRHFMPMIDQVPALPGARAFLEGLRDLGVPIVLASSAQPEELEHYMELLGGDDLIDGVVSSHDADSSKPAPDIFEAALEILGTRRALAVGDATWDCVAAAKAGIPAAGLLTGGFSEAELREAGAVVVQRDLDGLTAWLRGGDDAPGAGDDGRRAEMAALARLQGEVSADRDLVHDDARFARVVARLAGEAAEDDDGRRRLEERLMAMRGGLRQAGS